MPTSPLIKCGTKTRVCFLPNEIYHVT